MRNTTRVKEALLDRQADFRGNDIANQLACELLLLATTALCPVYVIADNKDCHSSGQESFLCGLPLQDLIRLSARLCHRYFSLCVLSASDKDTVDEDS